MMAALTFPLVVDRPLFLLIGEEALWWSFPVGSITSLALAATYYRFDRWRTMHMIEDRPAAGEPPEYRSWRAAPARASFARDAERLNDSAQAFPPATSIA